MKLTYHPPIELIYDKVTMDVEDDVVTAVQRLNINVNKEELLKALEYDRGQYEKGYADAMAEAIPVEWINKRLDDLNEYIDEHGENHMVLSKIQEAICFSRLLADWREQRKEE